VGVVTDVSNIIWQANFYLFIFVFKLIIIRIYFAAIREE